MGRNSREVELCHDEEEERASNEDVVTVLFDIGEGTWTSFSDCGDVSDLCHDVLTHGNLLPTLTMK